jgi:hypothetical protein
LKDLNQTTKHLNACLLAIREHEKNRNEHLEIIRKNTHYIDKNITKELTKLNRNLVESNRLKHEQNEILEQLVGSKEVVSNE